MIWWQKASVDYKLERTYVNYKEDCNGASSFPHTVLFSWMKDVNAITPDHLVRILVHVLPDYKQVPQTSLLH